MIKQIQLFLSADDEVALSSALQAVRPRLVFVDDSVWAEPVPVLGHSIAACKSPFVFLWDQGIIESLPTMARKDGRFEGPEAGLVVEVTRSRVLRDLMLSGRIAASTGVSDKHVAVAMDQFVADIWKVLKKMTKHPIVAVNPDTGDIIRAPVPEYRAGDQAVAWASSDPNHYFRDRSTQNFFKPKTSMPV